MNKLKLILLNLLLSSFCFISAEDAAEKNLNLGWIGYLNLPGKIQKDGKVVNIQTPKMWNNWSKDKDPLIDWFAKPKQNHEQKIKLYLLLDQSKKLDSKQNKRWKRMNK